VFELQKNARIVILTHYAKQIAKKIIQLSPSPINSIEYRKLKASY